MEGTIYVWQVFGEDNLVPGAFSFENGRGGRHPTHFLREESWGQSCKEKERHANTCECMLSRSRLICIINSDIDGGTAGALEYLVL